MMARGLEIDRGWKRMMRSIKNTSRSTVVTVGIQGEDAEEWRDGDITNVELATVHEYGTPQVPERSSFRSTFDDKRKAYSEELRKIAVAVLDGANLEGELLLLGEQYRSDVINKVRSHIPPPLADVTVDRKGGETTPLIDTGQLILQSISVEVKSGKDVKREAA